MITVSKDQKPPPHPFYGDNYERTMDPWHVDAFPDEFKHMIGGEGTPRQEGWSLLDAWGNEIMWCADGTVLEEEKDVIERLKKENAELKLLLEGANATCNKIAALVGDRGQYRDLAEAVEMKLNSMGEVGEWGSRSTYDYWKGV